ncbi:Subtilisin-like serine protease [Hahella chejuensis KCTC 2396]|uniref:Subtilisin-like serine protease n=2 Tax=Hahella chejuensis TaxID=158327 RepID=Q2SAD6_HAHCH|nr:Subtilisin-like serine protease [Hahella chejuensis KCTC 2396]
MTHLRCGIYMRSVSFTGKILMLTLAAALTACGGGGGDDETATYTLSGSITTPSFTQVDSDTSDTSAGSVSNNSEAEAQTLSNPVIIGGYVSASTSLYSSGELYQLDPIDVFRIKLLTGQKVVLSSSPASSSFSVNQTLTLSRVDGSGSPLSANNTGTATLTAPSSGDYYIQVQELAGPSSYVMVVGETTATMTRQAAEPIPAQAEFVPGEAIIRYKSTRGVSAQALPGYFLERFEDANTGLFRFDDAQIVQGPAFKSLTQKANERQRTLELIESLRQRPDIEFAEPNYIRKAMETPADPFYFLQWHYPQINLPSAWDVAHGAGVVVAVLDTGILPTHPDLSGRLVSANDDYDFVSSISSSLDGNGIDNDPTDPGDSLVGGSSFHGTHVAGTVAAASNTVGGVGVAFEANIMPIRVLGQGGSGSDADLVQAIRFAAGLSNSSGTFPSRRADIINMSLGGPGFSTALGAAVQDALNAGVIVVAAAGNENISSAFYPAAYPGVVSVSAVGADGQKAPYSNYGSTVDIAAPGGNMLQDVNGDGRGDGVLSTWADDSSGSIELSYAYMQGTSMASPHVAGVFALMESVRDITPDEINTYLANGDLTRDIGAAGRDDLYGYGLIDAAKAVVAAGGEPPPAVTASVSSLNFTNTSATLITLSIPSGVSGVSVTASTTGDLGWLSVNDNSDGDASTFLVSADASGLDLGVSYPGEIVVGYTIDESSEAAELTVPVTLTLADPDSPANAGKHYILLVNADTLDTLYQVSASASGGAYNFAFSGVEAGSYLLAAGTDLDNDGKICDSGEACAEYPVRNALETIVVNESKSGLSFATGFQSEISGAGADGSPAHKEYRLLNK